MAINYLEPWHFTTLLLATVLDPVTTQKSDFFSPQVTNHKFKEITTTQSLQSNMASLYMCNNSVKWVQRCIHAIPVTTLKASAFTVSHWVGRFPKLPHTMPRWVLSWAQSLKWAQLNLQALHGWVRGWSCRWMCWTLAEPFTKGPHWTQVAVKTSGVSFLIRGLDVKYWTVLPSSSTEPTTLWPHGSTVLSAFSITAASSKAGIVAKVKKKIQKHCETSVSQFAYLSWSGNTVALAV